MCCLLPPELYKEATHFYLSRGSRGRDEIRGVECPPMASTQEPCVAPSGVMDGPSRAHVCTQGSVSRLPLGRNVGSAWSLQVGWNGF